MGVCLGIYYNVFTLTHAFGFDSLRSKWNAPIIFVSSFKSKRMKTEVLEDMTW
jgi:hypothetical protein